MLSLPKLPVKRKLKAIAVLTSGGDAPGMNAAIRSVVRYGLVHGCEVYGVQKGYSGLVEGRVAPLNHAHETVFPQTIFPMTLSSVANIIQRGGTILKTDRCLPFYEKSVRREAANLLRRKGIEALVVIGGDGSFTGAHLMENETGFPTIGVPATIDNDIAGTEDTIGFDTAVNTALDAIDRIRDTASSHDRIFLVEVMGRSSGFIASDVGISGGAETILVPEKKQSLNSICNMIDRGIRRGKTSSIIVVAEGKTPGLSSRVAEGLSKRGYSSRVCILGHTQRGGSPTAHDRYLASVLGASALAYLMAGYSNAMVGVQKGAVTQVPFKKVIGKRKNLESDILSFAQVLAT